MTTSFERVSDGPPIDRVLDDIINETLRQHRVERKLPGVTVCHCGDSFDRKHGRSGTHRHHRHVAWALAWALREEGYAYVGQRGA